MSLFEYILNYKIFGATYFKLQKIKEQIFFKYPKSWNTDIFAPPLKIGSYTKELISSHYLEGRFVKGVKPVAWVTSGAPVEILKALGFYILYPENHGALCGAKKVAVELCIEAEKRGYSIDICSYSRTDFGSIFSGKTPVGKLPKPDLLLTCSNICQTVLYWYQVLSHYFKVPLLIIDTPFLYEKAKDYEIEYVKKQLEDSIPICEKIAKRNLNFKKLKKVVKLSKEATELWYEIIKIAKNKPSPISVFDQFIHMAPIVEMRGEEKTVKFYNILLNELKDRISNGIGAVKNEKKRVLWDNLPIWYKIKFFSEFLAENGVAVVASTYTNAWGELCSLIDPDRPIESVSKTYLHPILNRSTKDKLYTIFNMIDEFSIDGVILHSDRSCKPYSIGQIDQRKKFIEKKQIPAILIESDHNDSRAFSDEQIKNRLLTLIEMME